MALSRISTLAQQNFTMDRMRILQARIAETNFQASSGIRSQRYTGIATDSKQLVSLEASYVRAERFVENNKEADRRLQSMETQVATLFDVASDFQTTLVQALSSGNASEMALQQTAQGLLDQVAGFLNLQEDGRYLFAGSRTDTPPVDLTDAGFTIPNTTYPSTADTDYYQGNSQILSVQADLNLNVQYGFTADEPAFEKLIRSLHLTATNPGLAEDRMQEALRLAKESAGELTNTRARIGIARSTLETTNEKHGEFLLFTQQAISDVKFVDVTEAIARLQADSLALEASFTTLAQMRNISLVNFLS